jgi:uncharacterized protein (TIGR00299 family) protein
MIAYFECFSGISGDMILGSLVDAGVPPERLKKELSRLPVRGYEVNVRKAKRSGFSATRVNIVLKPKAGGQKPKARTWKDIEQIIKGSTLSTDIKNKGLDIFKRLFEAEAKVHGSKYNLVHLHELGAVDCIIDIFGTLIGLDALGIDTVVSSAINLGSGEIAIEHGILPVPAPATVELLRGVPVYSSDVSFELTTPTGAVLISSIAEDFVPMPDMRISKIGSGAGSRDFKGRPNVLRLFLGHAEDVRTRNTGRGTGREHEVFVIETNIDDMNPQVYEYVMDKLFRKGALDVFLTQIIMKKGRPAIKLTVLCSEEKKDGLTDIIFQETTSIGLRSYRAERKTLRREIGQVDTKFGKINVKVSRLGKNKDKTSFEYGDCKKIAKKFNIPLLEVMKIISS